MTFDEWYSQSGWAARHYHALSLDDADSSKYIMQEAWNAAIGATTTKIVRGTNLYNICGDYITEQVVDSLGKLKSS